MFDFFFFDREPVCKLAGEVGLDLGPLVGWRCYGGPGVVTDRLGDRFQPGSDEVLFPVVPDGRDLCFLLGDLLVDLSEIRNSPAFIPLSQLLRQVLCS